MSASAYRIRVTGEPGNVLVSLSGEVDYAASLELACAFEEITCRCEHDLLIDLGDVTMLDSEGIKLLLKVISDMRQKNACARIVRCSRIADRVIKLVGLDKMLEVTAC